MLHSLLVFVAHKLTLARELRNSLFLFSTSSFRYCCVLVAWVVLTSALNYPISSSRSSLDGNLVAFPPNLLGFLYKTQAATSWHQTDCPKVITIHNPTQITHAAGWEVGLHLLLSAVPGVGCHHSGSFNKTKRQTRALAVAVSNWETWVVFWAGNEFSTSMDLKLCKGWMSAWPFFWKQKNLWNLSSFIPLFLGMGVSVVKKPIEHQSFVSRVHCPWCSSCFFCFLFLVWGAVFRLWTESRSLELHAAPGILKWVGW